MYCYYYYYSITIFILIIIIYYNYYFIILLLSLLSLLLLSLLPYCYIKHTKIITPPTHKNSSMSSKNNNNKNNEDTIVCKSKFGSDYDHKFITLLIIRVQMINSKAIHAINHSNNTKWIKQKKIKAKRVNQGSRGEKVPLPLIGTGTVIVMK